MEKFTAVDESQNKVELLGRLEGELQWDYKWVVDLSENRPFGECMCHLRTRDDVRFAKSFQSINSMGISFPVSLQVRSLPQPEVVRRLQTDMTCMTLPKLPFPTTFSNSKSSIFRVR